MADDQIQIDKLEKVSKLGSGSFGTVYKVRNKDVPGETLVLKQLNKKKINYNNLMREIEILETLKANCQLYTSCMVKFEEDENFYYLLMTFEDDFIDLYKFMNSLKEPIDHELLWKIMSSTAQSLKYIHDLGLVHRDIKPENILVNPETGATRIIDFGFTCKATDEKCLRDTNLTPLYTSPDVFIKLNKRHLVTFEDFLKNDIWALGLTFYELLRAGVQSELHGGTASSQERPPPELQHLTKISQLLSTMNKINTQGKINLDPIKNDIYYNLIQGMLATEPSYRPTIRQVIRLLNRIHELQDNRRPPKKPRKNFILS